MFSVKKFWLVFNSVTFSENVGRPSALELEQLSMWFWYDGQIGSENKHKCVLWFL